MSGNKGTAGSSSRLAEAISDLQQKNLRAHRHKTATRAVNEKKKAYLETVGGFVQGYQFTYHEGNEMCHGSLILECHSKTDLLKHDATFLILGGGEEGRKDAERIYQSTDKMRGSPAIATVHLIAYCESLGRWIVCYERLCSLNKDSAERLGSFYDHGGNMADYWKSQLRRVITTLSDMGVREIYHGGMSNASSYALQSGTLDIKLIGLTREQKPKRNKYIYDLKDFDQFLCKAGYIKASSSSDWKGFSYLINSHAIEDWKKWAEIVLNHPILLDPEATVTCYLDLFGWTQRILLSEKIDFCNALYCLEPSYHETTLWNLIRSCENCRRMYWKDSYDRSDGITYTCIIKFVKNVCIHGTAYFRASNNGSWNDIDCINKMNGLFPGFMSLAYAVSKAEEEDMAILFRNTRQRPYCL